MSKQKLAIDAGYHLCSIFSNLRFINIYFQYDPVYTYFVVTSCDMN